MLQRDAFLLPPPPTVNLFAPVLNAIPQLLPTQQAKLNYCPPSVASIIDELRKDPMREVNPPNKVILSRSQIPTSPDASVLESPSPNAIATSINSQIFSFSNMAGGNLFLSSLNGEVQNTGDTGAAVMLHPVKIAHKGLNALNLPI